MRICYILNPDARSGKSQKLEDFLRTYSYPEGTQIEFLFSQGPGQAVMLAREAAKRVDVVCAVGGDGTLKDVAEGVYRAGTSCLGLIPCGTGNDMIRTFSWDRDPEKAVRRLVMGKARYMDVGLVNDRFFLNIASIGFDAKVVDETEHFKKKIKTSFSYKLGLLKALFTYKDLSLLRTNTQGQEERVSCFLFAVGNGQYYGGGFQILPQAKVDDGYFDICLVKNIARPMVALLLPSVAVHQHHRFHRYVEMDHQKQVDCHVEGPFILNMDGEIEYFQEGQDLHFVLIPRGLRIMGDA